VFLQDTVHGLAVRLCRKRRITLGRNTVKWINIPWQQAFSTSTGRTSSGWVDWATSMYLRRIRWQGVLYRPVCLPAILHSDTQPLVQDTHALHEGGKVGAIGHPLLR